ncbi:hypothetical protein [Microbulbifer epialgicus]|uniref:DUF4124 domain-containing protein n=1 Tax=Microbulbifer epialgicus TaxID=393907 RepID=A0ABV4P590_9GAMM
MKYAYMLGILLLVGVGLPMILPGPGGEPIISPKSWLPDQQALENARQQGQRALQTFNATSQKSAEQFENLIKSNRLLPEKQGIEPTTEVFTWQDGEGNWHFSDSVPEGLHTSVRIHRVKPLNTVPATQVSKSGEAQQPPATQRQDKSGADKRISQLLKEVEALQEKSRTRQHVLDNL